MTVTNQPQWDLDLIKRYDLSGPRYTSYPTAIQFDSSLNPSQLIETGRRTANTNSPLSLYVHIPFCSHACYFCACNKVISRNKRRAQPYLEQLHLEMKQLSQWYSNDRIVNQLHWGGGTPSFISDDEMKALMDQLRSNFNFRNDDQGDYSIEIDPREADASRIAVMRELGFNRISLGVQDIKKEVQQAVNRLQPIELTEEIILSARQLGYKSINTDLIYGLPHQTIDSFAETVNKLIELSPDRLSVFNYAHMPDRFRSQQHINASDLPTPEEKLCILENTINQLVDAGYVYIGMDHFAKPDDELAIAQQNGQLHRNFQGYTTHSDCDLVAMGVSAISQIGDVYYQNQHDLKTYQTTVYKQHHAINRGVILKKDDLIRRRVITQLICHFELNFQHIADEYDIDFNHYFADELNVINNYIEDGLVILEGNLLKVTPAGRLLIRRICMTFDAYISKQKSIQTFSKII